MYNTVTYFNNRVAQAPEDWSVTVSHDAVKALGPAIRGAGTLSKELRKSRQPETNGSRYSERRFRKPPVTSMVAPANGEGDVLLTILRDLHDTREDIINGCTCKDTLYRVDTLIDNIENYMAEA